MHQAMHLRTGKPNPLHGFPMPSLWPVLLEVLSWPARDPNPLKNWVCKETCFSEGLRQLWEHLRHGRTKSFKLFPGLPEWHLLQIAEAVPRGMWLPGCSLVPGSLSLRQLPEASLRMSLKRHLLETRKAQKCLSFSCQHSSPSGVELRGPGTGQFRRRC